MPPTLHFPHVKVSPKKKGSKVTQIANLMRAIRGTPNESEDAT